MLMYTVLLQRLFDIVQRRDVMSSKKTTLKCLLGQHCHVASGITVNNYSGIFALSSLTTGT